MFDLKIKPDRDTGFVYHADAIATYTVDQSYIATYDLVADPPESEKVLMAGYVMALDPTTQKVVPNYTTYGFEPVGVAMDDVWLGSSSTDFHDREINLLWRGMVNERLIWDNGDFNNVLQATKDALIERIDFVKETGLTEW